MYHLITQGTLSIPGAGEATPIRLELGAVIDAVTYINYIQM